MFYMCRYLYTIHTYIHVYITTKYYLLYGCMYIYIVSTNDILYTLMENEGESPKFKMAFQ